ncbi:MAG: hypothetical protein JW785_07510 [Acidimicrobiia bacterium]|nr:hypothetical protein [Acidimicrobiia bacterium]
MGAGPFTAVLGRNTTGALGAGPFWLSATTGRSKQRKGSSGAKKQSFALTAPRSQKRSSPLGSSRARPNADVAYGRYQDALQRQGVKRRNQVELAEAAIHATLLDLVPVVALASTYPGIKPPAVPEMPTDKELAEAAKALLAERGIDHAESLRALDRRDRAVTLDAHARLKDRSAAHQWWQRRGRANLAEEADRIRAEIDGERQRLSAALAAEVDRLRCEIAEERARLVARVDEAFRRFKDLDPMVNLMVLQAVFSDNGGTAAPLALEGRSLIVLMSFPPPGEAIWPERPAKTPSGGQTVKKRTKAEIERAYTQHLILHAAATVKEAFSTQPRLAEVRVVVVEEKDGASLADLQVLAVGTFERAATMEATKNPDRSWATKWQRVASLWGTKKASDFADAWSRWRPAAGALVAFAQGALDRLHDCWEMDLADGRLRPIGSLRDALIGADFRQLAADEDELLSLMTEPVEEGPAAVHDPAFWDEILALSEASRAA